ATWQSTSSDCRSRWGSFAMTTMAVTSSRVRNENQHPPRHSLARNKQQFLRSNPVNLNRTAAAVDDDDVLSIHRLHPPCCSFFGSNCFAVFIGHGNVFYLLRSAFAIWRGNIKSRAKTCSGTIFLSHKKHWSRFGTITARHFCIHKNRV